jgi:hypothetical protein
VKTKLMLAALVAVLAAAVVPTFASADPQSAIKADVAQLATDLKTARAAFGPDLQTLKADFAKGDQTAVQADVQKLRSEAQSVLPAVQKDRQQLVADLKAARDAGVQLPKGGGHPALQQLLRLRHQLRLALHHARTSQSG